MAPLIAKKKGLPFFRFYLLTAAISAMSLFGGFAYVLFENAFSTPAILRLQNIFSAGVGSYGAYLSGILGGFFLLKILKIDVLAALDIFAPVAALVHAFGRFACFLRGCCFGKPSNVLWTIQFPAGSPAHHVHLSRNWIPEGDKFSVPVHPVQIYDMLFSLVLWMILFRLATKKEHNGFLFFSYLISFATFRFFMEFVRDDYRQVVCGLSLPQALSLLFIIFGLSGLKIRRPGLHGVITSRKGVIP